MGTFINKILLGDRTFINEILFGEGTFINKTFTWGGGGEGTFINKHFTWVGDVYKQKFYFGWGRL